MKTAKEMLDKIKWDESEDAGAYTIYYKDFESLSEVRYVDIKRIEVEFMIVIVKDKETNVPLHRIKVIKKNGEVVWQR